MTSWCRRVFVYLFVIGLTLAPHLSRAEKNSFFFMEYRFLNSTGHHYSPALLFRIENPIIDLDLGIKPRFIGTEMDALTYLVSTRWLPLKYFGVTFGLYHSDYFYIDVGEDVVWFGPAFRFYVGPQSWFGIEGGINYRGFRLGGHYAWPFSFTGDGHEVNYFTVMELVIGDGSWHYRFALQNRDEFAMYRFQSLGIDNSVRFNGARIDFFVGTEMRFTGVFIGSGTMSSFRLYSGISF